MKIIPVGAELDGRTGRGSKGRADKHDVAVGAFQNFADAPKWS